MEIDLLYVPECPNRSLARDHLDRALVRIRVVAVVREREVNSSEEADRLGMRGSPTILIDERDPFLEGSDPTALACRLYRSEVGFSGAPTVAQLVDALVDGGSQRRRPTRVAPPAEVHHADRR